VLEAACRGAIAHEPQFAIIGNGKIGGKELGYAPTSDTGVCSTGGFGRAFPGNLCAIERRN